MTLRGRFIRWFYLIAIRLFFWLLAEVEVIGRDNIPHPEEGPIIIVSNHFSYFEVPLLARVLPKVPTYFGARELISNPVVKYGALGFKKEIIFVSRGVIDRSALKAAMGALQEKGWLAIFPEGGITQLTIDTASRGISTNTIEGHNSRSDAVLLSARPGAALLATQTNARILPIAFLGTEQIEINLADFPRNIKRTPIKVVIGPLYGPLHVDEALRGRDRRQAIDEFGHGMMEAIARLMPEENRGIYGYIEER